ncbi:MAG TPA: hypothetical protein PLV61_07245 [Parvularculaceae bacterium]|nr:hypothetical protein [Parvularculaceae bacterium]
MVRITMILLCLLLAAAAAGRYQAEVSVREARRDIERLDAARVRELSSIQVLRAEVAYLENPDRLSKIADQVTDLQPLTGGQLMTADEFFLAFGEPAAKIAPIAGTHDEDVILKALAMADVQEAE